MTSPTNASSVGGGGGFASGTTASELLAYKQGERLQTLDDIVTGLHFNSSNNFLYSVSQAGS